MLFTLNGKFYHELILQVGSCLQVSNSMEQHKSRIGERQEKYFPFCAKGLLSCLLGKHSPRKV